MGQAASAPLINDVATDLADPPIFTKSSHSATLSDKTAIAAAYPDLVPVKVPNRSVAEVLAAAKAVAATALPRASVVYDNEAEGALELLDITAIMRFKDDVAVRIRPEAGGIVVDMRSASRVGKGDLGCNAARIRTLMAALKKELGL